MPSGDRAAERASDRPTGAVKPAPANVNPNARVLARHRAGQTFVTFTESPEHPKARYRIYRSPSPLSAANLAVLDDRTHQATLSEGSGRAMTDRWVNREGRWATRYLDRWVVDPAQGQLPAGTGLFVLTVHTEDLGGATEAHATYAVTLQSEGGPEVLLGLSDPVLERKTPTQAVRAQTGPDGRGHVYVQYMDLRRWNPTFHAPRAGNGFLGFDAASGHGALAYAYTYVVSEPDPKHCEGGVPARLPVFFTLHGWGAGSYRDEPAATPYYCAIQITPTDFGETWFFGFAGNHDYRLGGPLANGESIVNFTEQRLLRMLDDLSRDPLIGPHVDPERVYAWGHSMGGSGALALATRYPESFAAIYASQPMTDPAQGANWLADVAEKWGTPAQRLPVRLESSDGRPTPLARYNGTPVFEWQHHSAQIKARLADEMAPFAVSHGRRDTTLAWSTQGRPAYADFDAGRRAWGGAITDGEHSWAAFAGLPPSLDSDRSLAPFQGFKVRRDETLPGLAASSSNGPLPPPDAPAPLATYNADLRWAASWDPWGPLPVDEPARWCVSLRTTDGRAASVEVTPRRTRAFKPAAGSRLTAQTTPLNLPSDRPATPRPVPSEPSDRPSIASGPAGPVDGQVLVRPDGLTVVPIRVTPGGVRLCLESR